MARSGSKRKSSTRTEGGRGIELVWPGKPTAVPPLGDGAEVELELVASLDPSRLTVAGASQTSSTQAPLHFDLPQGAAGGAGDMPNQLISGDNLIIMEALAPRLAGAVDLIYIDPPYATGLSYYSQHGTGKLQGGAIERRAYRDNRAGGMAGYLDTMFVRLMGMHQLLSAEGKLFVHCDWRANSQLRLLLDEIFGAECFRNEIIWRRAPNLGRQAASRQLGRVIDSIFVYSKTAGAAFANEVPRRRKELALDRKGKPKGARWDEDRELYFTTAPRGDYTDASIARLRGEGRVFESSTGTIYIKYFLTPGDGARWYKEQPVDALWDDFAVRPLRHRPKSEEMGYDTQKPEGLLERIITWATKPGDLVADFFCGSGTTPAVAEAFGRRWIACDIGQTAIDITRRRLLDLQVPLSDDLGGGKRRARPFDILSALRAERMGWGRRLTLDGGVVDDGEGPLDEQALVARQVLLTFGAEPLGGCLGEDGGRRVQVCSMGRPATERDVEEACLAAAEAGAADLVLLAWQWAGFDGAALRDRMVSRHGLGLSLRTIPTELLRSRPKRGKLRFAERPEVALRLIEGDEGSWQLVLADLRCPDPPKVRAAPGGIELGFPDLVDSWMVDWRGAEGAFSPSWCSHRSRADRQLALKTPFTTVAGGQRRSLRVKVVTVFGDEIARSVVLEGGS
jgi:adenine-specific DNA-methyltransferase